MFRHSILANKNKSVGSKNVDNTIGLDIQRTTRQFTHNDVVGTLDVNEQYLNERNACKDFRLTLTVNPFCSNELFNACTEIIWQEGSEDCQAVVNGNGITLSQYPFRINNNKVIGKNTGLDRTDMIRNTEYSSENIGFEYHPGFDFFNNHILRNKSYRIVNPLQKNVTLETKQAFNTLSDYMRLANGSVIQKCNRLDITDTTFRAKHLYDRTDILRFEDGEAREENLREENGWFGFYNTSVIPSKSTNGNQLDINRAINNKGNCEFVDMYPDRTLFSFVPKYNKYRNRLEDNWKIELTYAFESTTKYETEINGVAVEKDFEIVQSGNVNALSIASVEYVINQTGINVLLFRTYTKHNLKANDSVFLYFSEDENVAQVGNWHKSNKPYRVSSIGNLNGEYTDYYFTIYDTELLNNIFASSRNSDYTSWDYVRDYFYTPVANASSINPDDIVDYGGNGLTNIPSAGDVFIRVPDSQNIPRVYELYLHDIQRTYRSMLADDSNLSPEDFIRMCINNAFTLNDSTTSETSLSGHPYSQNDVYIQFRFTKAVGNNECSYYIRKFKKLPNMKNGHTGVEDLPFDNEKYRLGYSETIYGDPILQTVFTDNINVEGIKNNLGAKPSEIFATIIKTNVGHNEWYNGQNPQYSDYTDNNNVYHKIEFSHCFGNVTCGFNFFALENDTKQLRDNRKSMCDVKFINNSYNTEIKTIGKENDITIDSEWFYGDIVEFNPNKYTETTLCDVNFRFNTAQRELSYSEKYTLKYDEIDKDDYDYDGFLLSEHTLNNIEKKEGYYYKPHYRIKLKGYGPVIQDSHYNILVRSAEPFQNNGIYIKVNTGLKHNCAVNDNLILKDNSSDNEWNLKVVSILSSYSFIMTKVEKDHVNYIGWFSICEHLNNGDYSLKKENVYIPEYASKVNGNTFIWREQKNAWDIDNEDPDIKEYVFTNGAFYIDEVVNFYLKRQDPNNENGLWVDGETYPFFVDVEGERNKIESNYVYKEEYEAIC